MAIEVLFCKDGVEDPSNIHQMTGKKFFELIVGDVHAQGDYLALSLRFRKGMRLRILVHLQPMFENSEKNIRLPESGCLEVREEQSRVKKRYSGKRIRIPEGSIFPSIQKLQRLNDELYVANSPRAELYIAVVGFRFDAGFDP